MLVTALVFLLILSVLVLIHEAGHYFVAKAFGIKVEEFGFGIPPRAWGKKIGETIYSLNWLPIGGFVKLYGEDDAGSGSVAKPKSQPTKDLQRAFYTRPAWQRALVVLAGVIMNTVLAIIIYYAYLGLSGFKAELPLIGDHKFFAVHQQNVVAPIITEVVKDSPADTSGIKPLSKVISADNHPITTTTEFQKYILSHKGTPIHVVLQETKNSHQYTVQVTPRINPPKGQGSLGVGFGAESVILTYQTPTEKIFSGITHPLNLMLYNFDVLGKLIGISVKEHTAAPISEGVSGPVGIYSLVGTIIQLPDLKERIMQILNLAGILSISLAFFNVLPIPALDGGRLFFILIEMVTRKKVDPKIEGYAHSIGMAILLALILLITFKDILQLFK